MSGLIQHKLTLPMEEVVPPFVPSGHLLLSLSVHTRVREWIWLKINPIIKKKKKKKSKFGVTAPLVASQLLPEHSQQHWLGSYFIARGKHSSNKLKETQKNGSSKITPSPCSSPTLPCAVHRLWISTWQWAFRDMNPAGLKSPYLPNKLGFVIPVPTN